MLINLKTVLIGVAYYIGMTLVISLALAMMVSPIVLLVIIAMKVW